VKDNQSVMARTLEITDERLEELSQQIKPVVRFSRRVTSKSDGLVKDGEGDLYHIESVDLRDVAFTWDPKPARIADEVNPNPYKTLRTIHDYGAPVFLSHLSQKF